MFNQLEHRFKRQRWSCAAIGGCKKKSAGSPFLNGTDLLDCKESATEDGDQAYKELRKHYSSD